MLVMLGDGSENGAKVDRFEGRFGDVIAGSKGKRGARENDRVSGSCCGAGTGTSAWNSVQAKSTWRRFMRWWRRGCVDTPELHLGADLVNP